LNPPTIKPGGERRRLSSPASPFRLDLLVNPFGASLRVNEAIASHDELHLPSDELHSRLACRIAELHGIPSSWIVLGNGIAELIHAGLRLVDGKAALFSPTDDEHARLVQLAGREAIDVGRSSHFELELNPAGLLLPADGVALVQTPNDPTGTILSPQDAVRLSRRCKMLLIDERHVDYSPRTLLPLVREFDNVVLLRTFETWAGLSGFPIAYAVAPSKLATAIRANLLRPEVGAAALLAAHATIDDLQWVRATVDRVREEKSRLYRNLRKLNMVTPNPSWANFLLVRIERGDAETFERGLRVRGIQVHRPSHPAVADCLRISATTSEATTVLKNALIEIAARL
jgi:histidinol-phosphate aminotransferase